MAEDIVSIGIALDTSKVLQGTRQVDAALKQVAAASTTTAQATAKVDAAAKTAGQALTAESQAAQSTAQALRQETQATQSASQATAAFTQAAKQAANTLAQTGQAAQSAGSQIGGMGSAMRSFASQTGSFALAQVGVMGLQQALGTAKAALEDLVRTGITMQNLRTSFTAASGSVQAGAKDFQFVTQTALTLGLGLESVAAQYRSLSAATRGTTLQGAETRELFVTLSKAAQAYGLSTEQLGRVMSAFQQIISKGKVSMEELRSQLGDALPGALQIAARAYGVTTQAFEDMVTKGLAAEGFTRRFTAQLATEIPAATERAGKGITNLGTEIVLLKEAMAQSGLLRWLDNATAKTAGLLGMMRKAREAQQLAAEEESKRSLGPGATLDKSQADERRRLVEISKELAKLEDEIGQARAQQDKSLLGKVMMAPEVAIKQSRIDALRRERDELGKTATARQTADQVMASRQAELAEPGKAKKAAQEQEKDLQTFLKGAKALEDSARKAEAAQQTAMKAGLGREPSTEEKVKLQEKLVKDAQEYLEANQKLAEQAKDDPAVKALRARGQAQEAATKGLVDAKKASQDAGEAESKREREAKAAKAEEERLRKETERLDKQQADEVGRAHQQSIESLRQLNAKYTEAKTETDADRASKLAASLAYSQHAEEARNLAQAVGEATQALEDSRKTEARLPKLQEQAEASAGALSDVTRLRGQLEPRRRDQTRAEQHERILQDLEIASKGDPDTMAWARKQSAATLAFEETATQLERLKDLGEQTFETLGDALGEFVSKGKLDFKSLMDAITSDLLKFATQTILGEATKKGGWLETVFNLGMKAVGIAGGIGGGGATSGTLPTSWGDYGQMSAAGLFSGRQHGGPAYAGQPYMVGEAGPELFVPRTSGTVVPHGQFGGGSGPTIVNMHISTPNADSFQRSRGEIEASMVSAMQRAQRNA